VSTTPPSFYAIEMGFDGPRPGQPSIFPPPDEWSPDPAAGELGNSWPFVEAMIGSSLFSDRRVEPSELPVGETDRRGWWGDSFPEVDGDAWGSRLWLADRARLVDAQPGPGEVSPEQLADWARDSLAWLVVDRVVSSVDVTAERVGRSRVDLLVEIRRNAEDDPEQLGYQLLFAR